MTRHVLLVSTNAKDGRDGEFNRWYDAVHLPEVLGVQGVVAAQRFEAAEVVLGTAEHRYLAIYEIEAEDAQTALAYLQAALPGMVMTESFSLRESAALLCTPIGPRTTASSKPPSASAAPETPA